MTEISFEKAATSSAPACEVAAGKEGGWEAGPHPASSGAKMVGYKSTHILNPSVFNNAHVAWYRWYVGRTATLTLKGEKNYSNRECQNHKFKVYPMLLKIQNMIIWYSRFKSLQFQYHIKSYV